MTKIESPQKITDFQSQNTIAPDDIRASVKLSPQVFKHTPAERQGHFSIFCDVLWSEKPEELYICLFTLPGRESLWFQDPGELWKHACQIDDKCVYFGLGWSDRAYSSHQRISEKDGRYATGIPGFWADVDYGDHDNGKNYPPDQKTALKLLGTCEKPPSLVIDSGYGLHVYWAFESPWIFECDIDRDFARDSIRRWQDYIRSILDGYDLDSTADLERLLRVPGTYNRKDPVNPKLVKVIHCPGDSTKRAKYSHFSLIAILERLNIFAAKVETPRTSFFDVNLRADATPPADKLEKHLRDSSRFRLTWDKQRDDFPSGQHSASEYDLSLARMAAKDGWSQQEVTDLLIAFRRTHGFDVDKIVNRNGDDYIHRTLSKAFSGTTYQIGVEPSFPVYDGPGGIRLTAFEVSKTPTRQRIRYAVAINGKDTEMELTATDTQGGGADRSRWPC